MTNAEEYMQRLLDHQGYAIVGASGERPIGYVFQSIRQFVLGEPIADLEHPMTIIGGATREEYVKQAIWLAGYPPTKPADPHYYKVTAE